MYKRWIVTIAAVFLLSCYDFSLDKRVDSGVDSGKDADVVDANNPTSEPNNPTDEQNNPIRKSKLPVTTVYSPTSGGGTATSQQYRLYLTIGVPLTYTLRYRRAHKFRP
jgi:hypothetical protein